MPPLPPSLCPQPPRPATGKERLGAAAKGFLTRQLMQTDKVKNLIRTVYDTQRIIDDFGHESTGELTANDKAFLSRAKSQLGRAKQDLFNIFHTSAKDQRVALLQRHRDQKQDKAFKAPNTSMADGNTSDGGPKKQLSDATRRFMQRKKDGAAANPGATSDSGAATARRRTPGYASPSRVRASAAVDMQSPRHTDFLRRKTGTSASGKHSDAPTPPVNAEADDDGEGSDTSSSSYVIHKHHGGIVHQRGYAAAAVPPIDMATDFSMASAAAFSDADVAEAAAYAHTLAADKLGVDAPLPKRNATSTRIPQLQSQVPPPPPLPPPHPNPPPPPPPPPPAPGPPPPPFHHTTHTPTRSRTRFC